MSDTVATTPEDGQEVLALHCEQIDLTLKQCQSNALARNSAAIIESLQTLYSLLMEVKTMEKCGKVDICLRDVARELIRTNRVVMSIDDEIDGVVRETLYEDFGWYYEVSDLIAQGCAECDEHSNYMSNISESYDTERWIDKCLDLCGCGVSLEAAVDCLRRTVHYSFNSNNDISLKQQGETFGVASTVTSLRTIRRHLLHVPSLHQQDHDVDNNIFPATFQLQFATHDTSTRSMLANLLKFCILPLEYYEKREVESEPLLSDSLTDVTSKLSTLVSSACHAMDITLPWWASTKWMHTMLLQVA